MVIKKQKELIVLVGLPRSGKTTYARSSGLPIVSSDAIRLAVHGQRYVKQAEDMIWSMARYMAHALFLAGHTQVIIDGCHIKKAWRQPWVEKFGENYVVTFKHIATSQEECIRRCYEMSDHEIIPVLEKMAQEFEPLGPEERS